MNQAFPYSYEISTKLQPDILFHVKNSTIFRKSRTSRARYAFAHCIMYEKFETIKKFIDELCAVKKSRVFPLFSANAFFDFRGHAETSL